MKGPVPDENLREGFPDDVIGIRGSLLKAEREPKRSSKLTPSLLHGAVGFLFGHSPERGGARPDMIGVPTGNRKAR